MSAMASDRRVAPCRKGEARPVPEPQIERGCPPNGRRIGAVLPNEIFAAFRHYVALHGTTADQVLRDAVLRIVEQG